MNTVNAISKSLGTVSSRIGSQPIKCSLRSVSGISGDIADRQFPLVGANLSTSEFATLGRFQESVGKLKTSGLVENNAASAIAISPNGLFLTAAHCLEDGLSSFVEQMFGIGPMTFFTAEIPVLDKYSSIVSSKTLELQVVDVNSHLDIALLAARNPGQDPITFLKLNPKSETLLGSDAYKIGHMDSADHNLLSSGTFVNLQRKVQSGCEECSERVYVVTTAACGFGDSGGAIINGNGDLICTISSVYKPSGGDLLDGLVGDESVRNIVDSSNIFSLGTSVSGSVLPFLEKTLGKKGFKNLLDGDEVNISPKEVSKRRQSSPVITVIVFEMPNKPEW